MLVSLAFNTTGLPVNCRPSAASSSRPAKEWSDDCVDAGDAETSQGIHNGATASSTVASSNCHLLRPTMWFSIVLFNY